MSNDDRPKKLWEGRFTETTDDFVESFTASVQFDQRMATQDIKGSIAHATMLESTGILTRTELEAIRIGLEDISVEISNGNFSWSVALEDVHMNIEKALTDRIGDVGKKLHTGRSRNDQVATDLRLYLRDEIDIIIAEIRRLQRGILDLAELQAATIMPGFTHMQVAQPVTFGHHLMAWFEMIERDCQRLSDCRSRVNIMPLGAAALAGTSYPIDRQMTADLLGFDRPGYNSLDSVSDRDFVIEFAAVASLIMNHLSRWSEELVFWTSPLVDFIELPDRFCTGSSIMPQKKNPDVPELVRGKSGRVTGHLMSLLMLMKGQPLAYNKDNQEDKEPLFDTIDTIKDCLRVYADMIPAFSVKAEKMRNAALKGYATATDLADYLVRKGLPFRDAHEVVGQLVHHAIGKQQDLAELSLEEMCRFSDLIENDIFDFLTLEGSVTARNHIGGTAPEQVLQAITRARQTIKQAESAN
ncbi:MAG: argininosuccinate lyase [Gammaproteobacteria bacterium]|nr:argininosuccinate lyase [Gammaproteobacteria bacterium]